MTLFRGRVATLFLVFALLLSASASAAAAPERGLAPDASVGTPTAVADESVSGSSAQMEPAAAAISAPAVAEAAAPQRHVRPRPEAREGIVLIAPTREAAATGEQAEAATEPAATEPPRPEVPRLDEPVLRWLPEIVAAGKEWSVPAHIIAGVMRLESNGNPNIISPAGARGQMQIMPSNLSSMGVPEHLWHDPATNIRAGAQFLASRAAIYGSWDNAVGSYFGFGCDVFGTCTEVYISVVMGWANYYAPAIADPYNSGFAVLPLDWVPPPIAPFQEAAPPPVETPPPATPKPAKTPKPEPTTGGGNPTTEPTPLPTEAPTEIPTAVPTAVPTEIPTEPPTEVPTEIPTEPPAEAPVPPTTEEGA